VRGWPRAALWAVLLIPLLIQTYRYLNGSAFYGAYLHWTGDWSVWLLLLVLAVTPLRRLLGPFKWTSWLLKARRDLGIATFLYAAAHTSTYLVRKADLGRILSEAADPGMLAGWLALLGMLGLAATSNNLSVRWLAGRWKVLHRLVYPVALLSVGHWILTAFDPTVGYMHLAAVLLLFATRGWLAGKRPAARAG
jgi:sulfoxide reductase heme-binding subunit YedZ